EADGAFGDAERLAFFRLDPGMGGGGRMADQRFGAAQADRKLDDLDAVEETECRLPSTLDGESEGRAGAAALPCEQLGLARSRFQKTKIIDILDSRMIAHIFRDDPRAFVGALHP